MVRARLSSSGQFLDVAGNDNLTAIRWVDPATTVPAADRNGMIAQPFATIQAAIDSLAGVPRSAVVLSPGDYAAEAAVWSDAAGELLVLCGFGGVRNVGSISSSIAAATLQIEGIAVGSVTLVDTSLLAIEADFFGAVTANAASALRLIDSRFVSLSGGGNIEARDCSFGDVAGGAWRAWDCSFADAAAVDSIEALGCVFSAPLTAGPATLTGCNVADANFSDGVNATGCLFTAPIVAFAMSAGNCVFQSSLQTTSSCTLTSCEVRAGIDATGVPLQIDAASFSFARRVAAVTFGTLVFSDPPLAATVSVIVPAVAADAVGYVNTTLVGTALEDLFAVGDPVSVNPQTDLVAAGAGGGFINARISAANTLRCAFNGALAGGAANFTVAKVR